MDLKSNKEQAFVQLIQEHQGIIHKVCRLYGAHQGDHRDLFQEIVLQLWRAYDSYKGESRFTTWMYRVALNTAISGFRKQSRSPEVQLLSDRELEIPGWDQDNDRQEQMKLLYMAINRLSEIEKAIVMLHLEDHSYDEIAEIMGITRNHVGVKLNRIKLKLRQLLEPHLTDTPQTFDVA
ncbi:MAG: sigma-70 family RNA polymerase sigma factor [Bacteroidia bacterium]